MKKPPIITAEKASQISGIKILIYGSAGTGKTYFCGTAPNPLVISAESGLLTFRGMIKKGLLDKNTPVWEVNDIDDVNKALVWCKTEAVKYGIKTICLDSISEIAEKCLSAEKKKTRDARQAYGEMGEKIVDLLKDFRDIPNFNVIVTAKQTTSGESAFEAAKAQPTSKGKTVGEALPYLFDAVFHVHTAKDEKGNTVHYLNTKASFGAEAKDRSGELAEVEHAHAAYIIQKMTGE